MVNWLADKIIEWFQKRSRKEFGGNMIMYVVYEPEKLAPNVTTHIMPDLAGDEILQNLAKLMAERIRTIYEKEKNNG